VNILDKYLHIVSFDIPYPANYGGAIDVYYKLKALKDAGVKIILHNFQYGGRKREPILNEFCEKVYYYQRNNNKTGILASKPFIVVSRSSDEMLKLLASDPHPVLFEGIHTCLYLSHPSLNHKKRFVRTHNIEHEYYKGLAQAESDPLKVLYFQSESRKLKRFEKNLSLATGIITISKNDELHFSKLNSNICTVSAFHPSEEIKIKKGLGSFALYHGSLDVSENNRAALYLVNEVFNDIDYPLIIAGNKPSKELRTAIKKYKNIELKDNLGTEDFEHLVAEAQINILPTFQATGIKLKLLLALHNGRHLLVNTPMVANTGIESLCNIADNAVEMKSQIIKLSKQEINAATIENRKKILVENGFSNKHNVDKLLEFIF
jgi:hypothetical protein